MFRSPIHAGKAVFDGARAYVMGVVNVTPDSFSDGGRFLDVEAAVARGRALADEGADILDVGGESTRPGAEPVAAPDEIARVVPVIERLAATVEVPLSVDTVKGAVARAALAAGARIVNDVTGGRDPELLAACAATGAPLVVGHLRGEPRTMQQEIRFARVFDEVCEELDATIARARRAGVTTVIADPGIGFGKTLEHNCELLARAGEMSDRLGVPVMVGPSRKAFIGALTGRAVTERLYGTLGAVVAGVLGGADFVRVHDVGPARDALTVAEAIRNAGRRRQGAALPSEKRP